MSKLLDGADAQRILKPATTAKIALRMLSSLRVIADYLPEGLAGTPAVDILLAVYVAEDGALYPSITDLEPASSRSEGVTRRWVAALIDMKMLEQRSGVLALTENGHRIMTRAITELYRRQRELD